MSHAEFIPRIHDRRCGGGDVTFSKEQLLIFIFLAFSVCLFAFPNEPTQKSQPPVAILQPALSCTPRFWICSKRTLACCYLSEAVFGSFVPVKSTENERPFFFAEVLQAAKIRSWWAWNATVRTGWFHWTHHRQVWGNGRKWFRTRVSK